MHVVLPSDLREWLELEKELEYLLEQNQDEYLETVRMYFHASLHFSMAWVFESANWILPASECDYWGLPVGTKVMNHPYVWDFIHTEADGGKWKDKLFLASRGFIKTTTAKSIILREVSKNPEQTWLYVSQNKMLAIDRISRIKKEVKDNELFKSISTCPYCTMAVTSCSVCNGTGRIFFDNPESDRGSVFREDRFNCRRRSSRDEFTLRAIGLEKRLNTGDHYHRHCKDDCETKEGVNTLHMRNLMQKQHESLMSISDNYDFATMTWGTTYHYDGLHARLEREGIYSSVLRQPAEDLSAPPPRGYEDILEGAPVFLGPEILTRQRKKKEDYFPQMMLDPRGRPKSKFAEAFLRYYIRNPWMEARAKSMNIYLSLDGSKGKEDGDPQAIGVFGHGWDDLWYLLDAHLVKLDPDEVTDLVVNTAIMWNRCDGANVCDIITDGAGQSTDAFWIKKKLAERNFYIPVREVDCKLPKVTTHAAAGKINTFVLTKIKSRRWVFPSDLSVRISPGGPTDSKWSGKVNFVKDYLWPMEMRDFGFTNHDHFLDTMSAPFLPYKSEKGKEVIPQYVPPHKSNIVFRSSKTEHRGSWMSL